jgi:uncharacterized protein (DUF1800 family)
MLTQLLKPTNDQDETTAETALTTPTSRRAILAGGLTAALSAVAGIASAQQMPRKSDNDRYMGKPSGSRPPGGTGLTSGGNSLNNGVNGTSQSRNWGDNSKRLLRRISYGPTQSDLNEIESLGYDAYLDRQINYSSIDDSACESLIQTAVPNASMTLNQINQLSQGNSYIGSEAAVAAMIIRSVKSKRQLYQRMVEFYQDHFHVMSGTHFGVWLHYQREVIWANAMGSFKDILKASANHGLMMLYLDNRLSTANNLNVNYAREIMELHTLGVNGGYTEEDIYQLADILTGWAVEQDNTNLNYGEFRYNDSVHAQGTRTVMGQTFAQQGKAQGDAVIDWLASHPSTIKFMADKLCMWFLGRPASPQILVQISAVWGTDGNIPAVLRVILDSANIAQIQPIFKRPFHLIVGALRQSESNLTSAYWVREYLKESGHSIGSWVQPDGFPNGFSYWSGGMVKRFKLMTHFAKGRMQNAPTIDVSGMDAMSDGERMAFINNAFFLGELPVSDQIWIRRYMKGNKNHKQAIAIALCSPSYQWF